MGERREFNAGIGLLRLWMAFAVTAVHCLVVREAFPAGVPVAADVLLAGGYAVPVFMTLAFFFSARHFETADAQWLGHRMFRLFWPFVVWSVLTFVVDRAFCGGANIRDPFGGTATWEAFGWHLIGGTALAYHLQMWFMAVLIWLTPCFFLLFRHVPAKGRAFLWVFLFVAAFGFQYTGFNKWLCSPIPVFGLRIPAGRLLEMLPYACLGLLIAAARPSFGSLDRRKRMGLSVFFLALFAFFKTTPVFLDAPGFSYSGLGRMAMAVSALGFFYFLPLEGLPRLIGTSIAYVSRYALGIYMVHNVLGFLLHGTVFRRLGLTQHTLLTTLIVFVVSWFLCWLIGRVPCKWTRALVE